MGRKTHPRRRPQARRDRPKGGKAPVHTVVVKPSGYCRGKLCFATEEIAAEALEEARRYKIANKKTDRIEKRYYDCDTCGQYHLTLLETWVDHRTKELS